MSTFPITPLSTEQKAQAWRTIMTNPKLHFHHTATAQGYVSRKRKEFIIEPYKGRFGSGYKIHYPRYDTTQYHCVSYYIYEEE